MGMKARIKVSGARLVFFLHNSHKSYGKSFRSSIAAFRRYAIGKNAFGLSLFALQLKNNGESKKKEKWDRDGESYSHVSHFNISFNDSTKDI